MSYFSNYGQKMMHAAVNTDPLKVTVPQETNKCYYRLKERNIPHMKITDARELKAWYDFGEKIGQGAFGVVLSAVEKSTSKNWAVKTVIKTSNDDYRLHMVQREIQILKLIRHPHVIYLYKVYETPRKIYMIFERCYGELTTLYNQRKPFGEKIARKVMKQLTEAVAYLHKYDIVHRDVKMENILLGKNPSDPNDQFFIKLTDFGLSIVKHGKGIDSMLHDFCGTLFYMAPEIITLRSYSQQCDVWAIGVILYMMVTGMYPFFSNKEKELHALICSHDPDFSNTNLSVEVTDLILLLLTKNAANRLTAAEVLRHPWMLNRKLSKATEYNILKMMKEWKSEMKVAAGQESDWVAIDSDILLETSRPSKQPMSLPKTNIHFDRSKKLSNSKQSYSATKELGSNTLQQKNVSKTRQHSGSPIASRKNSDSAK